MVFILTGQLIIPAIAQFRANPGTKMITITVNARCALRQLQDQYTEVRRQMLGLEREERYNPVTSERAMELAVFAAEQ